ncbi:hypothetical protein AVEN_33480-1 [Araneus ventricosus]|uniref:Uncharacterized protein n=1 Tax=Araneus ventricosus TaxID=182803 RepID=A0A4Y2GWJ7_ARAVE|nr:hypothetical protein AVEN_33480-1 [Araneus ventricosus]
MKSTTQPKSYFLLYPSYFPFVKCYELTYELCFFLNFFNSGLRVLNIILGLKSIGVMSSSTTSQDSVQSMILDESTNGEGLGPTIIRITEGERLTWMEVDPCVGKCHDGQPYTTACP